MPGSKRDVEEMKIALLTHFQPISTVTLMRCKMWTYQQPPSEKVAEFAHRIRVLGAACDLHHLEDSITRDTFICNLERKTWIDELIVRTPPLSAPRLRWQRSSSGRLNSRTGMERTLQAEVSSQGVNDHP